METIFLAGLWGPALLAFGLGIFISRDHYMRVYRNLGQEPFAMLVFGLAAIAAGVTQVAMHNSWDTTPEIVVSLLGWLLLLKGAVVAIMPDWSVQKTNWFAVNPSVLQGAAAVTALAGIYLSYIAYFA